MRTRTAFLAAAALLGLALPARAQHTAVDSRWLAFLGCWEPVANTKSVLCVVPAGTGTVDLVTIKKGEVVERERIAATGQPTATTDEDCTGSETGEWSAIAVRVYLRSTETCAGALRREGTGIIAMTGAGKGDWVYIQGVTLGAAVGQTGVRVQRYREVDTDDLMLPDDIKAALPSEVASTMRARTAALAPLAVNDLTEASRKVDPAVVQAWLIERGRPFVIDAKKLVALADAGVPSSTIDLVVALSYPGKFAINAVDRQGERLSGTGVATVNDVTTLGQCAFRTPYWFDPFYDPYYDCMGRGYGYSSYGYGYGYGYGYPYNYFGGPVIVYIPSSGGGGGGSGSPRSHGRMVNGQGYTGGTAGGNIAMPRSSEPASTSSGSTGSPSASSASSSSSSSGSSERTAHRRP